MKIYPVKPKSFEGNLKIEIISKTSPLVPTETFLLQFSDKREREKLVTQENAEKPSQRSLVWKLQIASSMKENNKRKGRFKDWNKKIY